MGHKSSMTAIDSCESELIDSYRDVVAVRLAVILKSLSIDRQQCLGRSKCVLLSYFLLENLYSDPFIMNARWHSPLTQRMMVQKSRPMIKPKWKISIFARFGLILATLPTCWRWVGQSVGGRGGDGFPFHPHVSSTLSINPPKTVSQALMPLRIHALEFDEMKLKPTYTILGGIPATAYLIMMNSKSSNAINYW
ncbi:hypothetical protein Nepgr_026930 [Nepenthes gracilis]|uniref:Uncharacterized protein n=1 Tax=Nepenthes gracilis TaxID=150966 RepID=A0AAD3T926_NEPGR|nr:hypothetical protein Nepgr_026930 [Nepenthes gracilis]